MKRSLFEDGQAVQVGFLDIANSQYIASGNASAIGADAVVLVTPTAGGVWIALNGTATAATAGSHYIEFAQDFAVLAADVINSTGAISITPYR